MCAFYAVMNIFFFFLLFFFQDQKIIRGVEGEEASTAARRSHQIRQESHFRRVENNFLGGYYQVFLQINIYS